MPRLMIPVREDNKAGNLKLPIVTYIHIEKEKKKQREEMKRY